MSFLLIKTNHIKKLIIVFALTLFAFLDSNAQIENKVITSVESIVPGGLGKSHMISSGETRDYKEFSSEISGDQKEDGRNKSKQSEIRIKDFEETKLLNFYNLG